MSQLPKIEAYWSTRAMGYSARSKDELKADTKFDWIDKIYQYAPKKEKMKILDIGCGAGFFSILMAQCGHDVTGIDYTEDMLICSKKNAQDAGVAISFNRMDAQQLDFADDTFDLIVSRNVTWVLEQPEQAYKEWLRVLRPEGRLINFDENHYMYLFDQQYQKEKELRGEPDYMKTVKNTHIMEEIARDLPLSKQIRPTWDVQALFSLDVSKVMVDVYDKKRVTLDETEKILYNSFIICAQK